MNYISGLTIKSFNPFYSPDIRDGELLSLETAKIALPIVGIIALYFAKKAYYRNSLNGDISQVIIKSPETRKAEEVYKIAYQKERDARRIAYLKKQDAYKKAYQKKQEAYEERIRQIVLNLTEANKNTELPPTTLISTDLEALNEDGETALMISASNGDREEVEALIKAGANVNFQSVFGDTPLMQASEKGHLEIVQTLLGAGATVDLRDNYQASALDKAVANRKIQTVALLASKGANLNFRHSYDDETVLMWASREGWEDMVKTLINCGADCSIENDSGRTAAIIAYNNRHQKVVDIFLKQKLKDSM